MTFPVEAGQSLVLPDDIGATPVTFTMPNHNVDLRGFLYFWDGSQWVFEESLHHEVALQPAGAEFDIRNLDLRFGERVGDLGRRLIATATVSNVGDQEGRGCVRFTSPDLPDISDCAFIPANSFAELKATGWGVLPGERRVCVELI